MDTNWSKTRRAFAEADTSLTAYLRVGKAGSKRYHALRDARQAALDALTGEDHAQIEAENEAAKAARDKRRTRHKDSPAAVRSRQIKSDLQAALAANPEFAARLQAERDATARREALIG